jgi:hypothetical protein
MEENGETIKEIKADGFSTKEMLLTVWISVTFGRPSGARAEWS